MSQKEEMNPVRGAKLFKIAQHLGDLNKNGDVKCRAQNDYGHAKVSEIIPGCSVWVHHMFDNKIILDLLISSKARQNSSEECNWAEKEFNKIFKNKTKKKFPYLIPSMPGVEHTMHSIDITNAKNEIVFGVIEKINEIFRVN